MARLAVLALSTVLALPAFAETTFDKAEGSWKGEGWVKREAASTKEAVRCRITSDYEAPRLKIEGKCAAAGTNFQVKGYVDEKGNGFSGRWYNPFGADTAPIAGKRNGEKVDLRFEFKDKDTDKVVKGTLEWKLGSDELVLSSASAAPGGKAEPVSRIVFTR